MHHQGGAMRAWLFHVLLTMFCHERFLLLKCYGFLRRKGVAMKDHCACA